VRPLRLLSVEAPESIHSSFLFVLGTLWLRRFFLPASGRGDLFFLFVMERCGIVLPPRLELIMGFFITAGFRATDGDCLHSVVFILGLTLKRGTTELSCLLRVEGVVTVVWFEDRILGPDAET
jgi:hypothetical protein